MRERKGSEVFRQERKSQETCARCHLVFWDVCACHPGSGAVGPQCVVPPRERCRVRTWLCEKSIHQRGEEMQMAGPVGDASSSDQTAGGKWSWCQRHLRSVSLLEGFFASGGPFVCDARHAVQQSGGFENHLAAADCTV